MLPNKLCCEEFLDKWARSDLLIASCQNIRDEIQSKFFNLQKTKVKNQLVPLLYHPKDTRKQNISVQIPGTDRKEELVLNDIIDVNINAVESAIETKNWRLGYALTIHTSQGLTIKAPQKVWIIDDHLTWANLAYLAVGRVVHMHQLERVAMPHFVQVAQRKHTKSELRHLIQRKLVS